MCAVTHRPAREQHVGRERRDPVADLVAGDAGPARAICGSCGSHQTWKVSTTTPTAGRELLGDVERLSERRDHRRGRRRTSGAAARSPARHRPRRRRRQLADGVPHPLPGAGQVRSTRRAGRRRRARARRRSRARRGRHRRGLVDGPAVVVERGPAAGALGRGEESAAAEARHPQPGVGQASRPPRRGRPRRPVRATARCSRRPPRR